MTDLTSEIQLYDSDIPRIEAVADRLEEWVGKRRDLEDFRQECIGRFNEIGLVVNVLVHERTLSNDDLDYEYTIEITGRTEKHEFDFDRQVHEVTNDILELLPPGERGTIKTTGGEKPEPIHKH